MYSALLVVANNTAHIIIAGESAIGDDDVLDNGMIDIAEETNVIVISVIGAGAVDDDAADTVTMAVVGALEVGTVITVDMIADGRIVVVACDVLRLTEGEAAAAVLAVVHVVSQMAQVAITLDFVCIVAVGLEDADIWSICVRDGDRAQRIARRLGLVEVPLAVVVGIVP